MESRKINPWQWQDQFGFSQAIEITGHTRVLHCSGQIALNEDGEPQHEGDMAAQVALAMDNVEKVLDGAGMTLANVVQINHYTTDIDNFFEAYEEVHSRLVKAGVQPASTWLGVVRLAFPPLMIEIEVTAVA